MLLKGKKNLQCMEHTDASFMSKFIKPQEVIQVNLKLLSGQKMICNESFLPCPYKIIHQEKKVMSSNCKIDKMLSKSFCALK